MKVYVETNGKYILLDEESAYDNLNNEDFKQLVINKAMDMLEMLKLNLELQKQKEGNYLVKKLGLHPSIKNSI